MPVATLVLVDAVLGAALNAAVIETEAAGLTSVSTMLVGISGAVTSFEAAGTSAASNSSITSQFIGAAAGMAAAMAASAILPEVAAASLATVAAYGLVEALASISANLAAQGLTSALSPLFNPTAENPLGLPWPFGPNDPLGSPQSPLGSPLSSPVTGGQYVSGAAGAYGSALKDPLVIDVSGNGLNLTALSQSSPYFNWSGTFANETSWIGAGTGFLVAASTNGGTITAANLITSFAQLQALDVSHTGLLNASDPGFRNLEVWQDVNGDGIAESSEVLTLAQLGITSIVLNENATTQVLNGDSIEAVSSVNITDGSKHEIAAVSFNYSPTYTESTLSVLPSDAATQLPQLHGYGNLTDLQEAMTNNPVLLGLVQSIVTMPDSDSTTLGNAIVKIMYAWAGVDKVAPWSAGPLMDARQVGFLEKFLGIPFLDAHGDLAPKYSPETQDLKQSWNAAFKGIAARLLLQGPMANAFADFTFDSSSDLIVCTTSFSQALNDVAAQAPADTTGALQFWWAATTILDQFVLDWQSIDNSIGANVVPASAAAFDALLEQTVPLLTGATLVSLRAESFNGSTLTENGSGTVTFNPEAGFLQITSDAGAGNFPTAILSLGAGIISSQLQVTSDAQGNLNLQDGVPGDQIQITGMMMLGSGSTPEFGIKTVQFANGTTLSAQQLITLADTASPTNATLYGFQPQATFIYAAGTGRVEINEDAGFNVNSAAILEIGPGISADQLAITADSAGNLSLTDARGDQIKIDGGLNSAEYGVAQVQFADGTTWDRAQMIAAATTGTAGADNLYGSGEADTFDGKGAPAGSQDYEQGGDGGDTFIYNQGYGQLEINESDWSGSTNVLKLGAGITAASITVTGDNQNNMFITDGVGGDRIQLDNELNGGSYAGLQVMQFADGSSLSKAQLIALAGNKVGTAGADSLAGSGEADIFDGKGAPAGSQDYEQGGDGGDTFVYNQGYGQLEINESDWSGSTNVLQLGPGIIASTVTVTGDNQNNMFITDGVGGDRIQLDNELNGGSYAGLQTVQFADGSTLSKAQLTTLAGNKVGTAGADSLAGSGEADIFDGKGAPAGSQDYEQGGDGGDTFVYNQGYGQLEINESDWSGSTNVLKLGAGITAASITVTGDNQNNMFITDGVGGDRIQLDNELNGGSYAGLQVMQFADGSSLSKAQLTVLAGNKVGSTGADNLYGSGEADIFDGKGAPAGSQDYEQGGDGGDTFVYNQGYGQLEINESDWSGSTNVLHFGFGITPGQISVSINNSNDLFITDGNTGDNVKIDNGASSASYYGLQSVRFDDGTVWSKTQLIAAGQN